LSRQCSYIRSEGVRCRGVAVRGSDPPLCAAHDPRFLERRRAGARRGGRARGASEIVEIKGQLAALYGDVISGRIDRGIAAVGAQVENVRLRAIEIERKVAEADEYLRRIEDLERRMEGRGFAS
jgi:hypothetical protein